MPFFLRTFGPLELLGPDGERLAGAATQPKPLLILALAALTPGGISRDQLLQALWPDGDAEKARATLKQHLYALRRATGETELVGGSPRLGVDPSLLQVDADRLMRLVDEGRLLEAGTLVHGPLLEGIAEDEEAGLRLRTLVHALRDRFAAPVALVRAALAEERDEVPGPAPRSEAGVRALRAAVRRYVQGMYSLPADGARSLHRASACTHELFEALLDAEADGIAESERGHVLDEAATIWDRSPLLRRMRRVLPGDIGDLEIEAWLQDGAVRSVDPLGGAVERVALLSPLASHPQAIAQWQVTLLGEVAARLRGRPWRVLVLGADAARAVATARALFPGERPEVVLVDRRSAEHLRGIDGVADPTHPPLLVGGDPFAVLEELAALGPFDLILTGRLYDALPVSQGAWLTARLLPLLADGGVLACAALRGGRETELWFHHLADRPAVARDREALHALLGPGSVQADRRIARTPGGATWLATLTRPTIPG